MTNRPTSTAELRRFLLDCMVSVGDGEMDVGRAKAVCNLAQQAYNTVNLEIKAAQARSKIGEEQITALDL